MYCIVQLKTHIFAPQLNNKTLTEMKNMLITTAALITLSATIYAANLDARFINKDNGENERVISIHLPEVIIQDVKTGCRIQKAVLINGELVIVHYLPAVEITADKPAATELAINIKEVQLPEVHIEGFSEIHYQTAFTDGNQVVPVVQLSEVVITAHAEKATGSITLDEPANGANNVTLNLPAISVEFVLLTGIISFLLSIIPPVAG